MRPHRSCCLVRQLARLAVCAVALVWFGAPASEAQPVFSVVNRASGLPSDYINTMYQDRFGFLWFGTDSGLARYDGQRVETFTADDGLPHPFIYAIQEDGEGTLWAGTFAGLARFDGHQFQMSREPFGDQMISTLSVDERGRLIVMAEDGIARQEGDRWRRILRQNMSSAIVDVVSLSEGRLVGSGSGTLVALEPEGSGFRAVELASGWSGGSSLRVARGDGSNLYVFGPRDESLLYRIRVEGEQVVVLDSASVGPVSEFVADGNGGAALYREGGTPGVYRMGPGLNLLDAPVHPGPAESLMYDYEGGLWIGTFGRGAFRLGGEHLEVLTDGPATRIEMGPRGQVWATTDDGLWQIDPQTLRAQRHYLGTVLRELHLSDSGELWMNSGPTLFDGARRAGEPLRPFRSDPGWISGIDVVGDTVRVSSYSGGIRRVVGGVDVDTLREGSGLPTDMVEGLERTSRSLWAITRSHGAFRITGGRAVPYGPDQGLPSSSVFSVYSAEDGSTWFGTNQGIARLPETGSRVEALGEALLGGQRVTGFFERDGFLWVLGERVLYVIASDEIFPVGGFSVLPSEDASINDVVHDSASDRLFLATTEGVVSVDLAALPSGLRPRPRVAIRSVRIGEADVPLLGNVLAAQTAPVGPGRQRVEIEFASLSYSGPVYAEVRLNDEDWSNVGTERRVVFPELGAGTYRFEVRAVSEEGQLSAEVASLEFTIEPYWWQQSLAIVLFTLLGLSALVLAVRYISQRRLREEIRAFEVKRRLHDERERISRDLHDHVGAQLSSLLAGVELVRLQRRASGDGAPPSPLPPANDALDGVEADARTTMRQLRETIWALHGASVSLEEFASRVRSDLAARSSGLDATVTCAEGSDKTLSPVQALNLYRITQEAITNALKHAGARQLEVTLRHDGDTVRIAVRDDGTFRAPPGGDGAGGLTGFGMKSMQARAESLGGDMTVDTTNGTAVHVAVPAEATDVA